ncbi:MBL fold metallo-hydrolase [Nonomuraea sp. NBC_00507]|uniref:MBL fold metallo-hydrolase n=1 Tax=Nonomuraea sp. NBC_00507 TaxID=2976002 RepID=UPI002E18F87B
MIDAPAEDVLPKLTGKISPERIRLLRTPRPLQGLIEGFKGIADATSVVSDIMDELGITGVIGASVLIIAVAGTEVRVLHTPGHAPGACSFHVPDLGAVFTGDTLFQGGPGATGRSYSSFETIIASIRDRLLVLQLETIVHTGHGPDTTIGAEQPHVQEWIRRGH